MKNLVIVAPNWLGDAVMALPAIADVRRALPEVSLTAAARPSIAPLFELVPGIDAVVTLPPRASWRGPWRPPADALRAGGFEAALLLPNSMHAALAAARAGIPGRWGYRTQWRGPLLTRAVEPPSARHQVEYYRHLVGALGCPNGPAEPRLPVTAPARDAGARALIAAGWDGRAPIVALAPGAAYGGAKRWPPPHFAELAAALAADGLRVALVGSAADRATGDEVARACPARDALIDLIGRTDLAALAGVLAIARALVTNDSGAMHLGAAVGTSVTAVFGPTDERATRPLGDAHAVLTCPVWCRPCMLRECPLDHRCLRGVGVPAVLDAARRTL